MCLVGAFRIWVILAVLPLLAACQTTVSRVSPAVADELASLGFVQKAVEIRTSASNPTPVAEYTCSQPKCGGFGTLTFDNFTIPNSDPSGMTFEEKIKSGKYTNSKLNEEMLVGLRSITKKVTHFETSIDKNKGIVKNNMIGIDGNLKIYGYIVSKISANSFYSISVFSKNASLARKYASARYLR
jgi:hypothetical protein